MKKRKQGKKATTTTKTIKKKIKQNKQTKANAHILRVESLCAHASKPVLI